LRAILVGPDRQVLDEATIADDRQPQGSGAGSIDRVQLRTDVAARGVYALNITITWDRYGEETELRFRTNCPRYLIETARGLKDGAHQEPIVLHGQDQSGDLHFLPRDRAFQIEVEDLPGDDALILYDNNNRQVASLPVNDGRATA